MMLDRLVAEGEPVLDRFLECEADRDLLFRRFSGYRPFAEAYRCPLNESAAPEERVIELAPGRHIRFVRLNSAIACSRTDEKGKLLLGARQRVLQPDPGEELVVISHHPLQWFQDGDDALLYFRNRARVYMSGHEHFLSAKVEQTEQCGDLLMLAAGATVPPYSDREFGYRYNIIEFDWDPAEDSIVVDVRPRIWQNEQKRFDADTEILGGRCLHFVLACPFFRRAKRDVDNEHERRTDAFDTVTIKRPSDGDDSGWQAMDDKYALLLLRFFRDITAAQRLAVLTLFDAIPSNYNGTLNESFQRMAFDAIVRQGRVGDLELELCKMVKKGEDDHSD